MVQVNLGNWSNAKHGDICQINYIAVFTLIRSDNVNKKIMFEDEPGWILIKGTNISNGHHTPAKNQHDRIDFNKRNVDVWWGKAWVWLNEQAKNFSEGKSVKIFYNNPYKSIGGFFPQ